MRSKDWQRLSAIAQVERDRRAQTEREVERLREVLRRIETLQVIVDDKPMCDCVLSLWMRDLARQALQED